MAARRDSLPKTFRIVPCARCQQDFQSTGPNHKRCDPCKREHKREYESRNKRAKNPRLTACSRCSKPFEGEVHAHQRYCARCSVAVRNESSAARMAADPEHVRQIARRSYEKRRRQILEKRKNEAARRYAADAIKRRRTDPGFRLHSNISRVVSLSLNGERAGRKWQTLVGYTLDDLRRHLERQFVRGMTWANYGKAWHVDHILPRASFAFSSAEDDGFKACWALTNLRPLWSRDNLSKSGHRIHLI